MREIWKKIPGLPERYEASSLGQLRRLGWDEPITSKLGLPFTRKKKIRVLRFSKLSTAGYLRTGFEGKTWYVHRLVCAAFHPNPDGLREVNHRNGIKTDNRASNLEWISSIGNHRHAWKLGLYRRGVRPHLWKYDPNVFAKLYFDEKLSTCEIAAKLGTYPFIVGMVLRRAGFTMRSRHESLAARFRRAQPS